MASGGSRGKGWGAPRRLISGKKNRIRKKHRQSKQIKLPSPPPPPLAQGLDPQMMAALNFELGNLFQVSQSEKLLKLVNVHEI